MKIFYLPDLGEGLQEAEIVAWHVAEGDHVVADQPLVSVETDKAVVEVPAPYSGHIEKLLAEPGERLEVGAPLVEFEQGVHGDAGGIVGEIARAEDQPTIVSASPAAPGKLKVTPAVRAMAKKLDVDLTVVQATGPKGAITSQDVERAAKTLASAAPPEPLRGVRRAMAERMVVAHREVVPVTLSDEADIECWPQDSDIMLRLVRAVAVACRAAPALNTWFDGSTMTRRLHQKVDLGIAVNTENGLFVPVLRDVGHRNPSDLKQGLERLKADVRARTVPPRELRGQTITLSNFGTLAGRFANLIVVPPQVAILGAGKIAARVVALDGKPVVHRLLPLSLSFDHRAVTGGEAAAFLVAAITDLEQIE